MLSVSRAAWKTCWAASLRKSDCLRRRRISNSYRDLNRLSQMWAQVLPASGRRQLRERSQSTTSSLETRPCWTRRCLWSTGSREQSIVASQADFLESRVPLGRTFLVHAQLMARTSPLKHFQVKGNCTCACDGPFPLFQLRLAT